MRSVSTPHGPGHQTQPRPGYSAPPTGGYVRPTGGGQRFGVVGAVLAIVGAILAVLAFTVLPWLRQDTRSMFFLFEGKSSHTTFGKLHTAVGTLQHRTGLVASRVHFGVAPAYFGWLAWVLLAVAFVLAILAVAPLGPVTAALRPAAALVALAGIGLSLWAIDLFSYDRTLAKPIGTRSPSYTDYLSHGSFAFWATLLGFVLIGAGALIGPRRTTATSVVRAPAGH